MSRFNDIFIARFIETELAQLPGSKSGALLDLGCGTRPYLPLYSHRFRFSVAADYDTRGVIDVRLDARALPFPDGSFDVALLSEVIEHIAEPDRVLREICRVLKPGGVLFITWPFNYMIHEVPDDYFRLTEFGFASLLKGTGMRVEHLMRRGGAMVVATALCEFLLFGALAGGTRLPVVGALFKSLRWFLGRMIFEPAYRSYIAAAFHRKSSGMLSNEHFKGVSGHLSLWTLGYCARVRKDFTARGT